MTAILSILYPVLAIGGISAVLGFGLAIAGNIFAVPVDERLAEVRDSLPGANCAGCGYPGCDTFAEAVINGEASVTGCTVGGNSVAQKVAEIMGVSADEVVTKVAVVKCGGSFNKAVFRYNYYGLDSCRAAQALAGGGSKSCKYGCLGNGSCVKACQFNAISIVNGIAVVNTDKCTACGVCVGSCPRDIIELVPKSFEVLVNCNSPDSGKVVKSHCEVGCIGCKLCEKACKFDAIHINHNLAKIDYEKCVNCGLCKKACPVNAIL